MLKHYTRRADERLLRYSAPFHSGEKITPSKHGIEQLKRLSLHVAFDSLQRCASLREMGVDLQRLRERLARALRPIELSINAGKARQRSPVTRFEE